MAATARENLFKGALPHVDRHGGELLEDRSNVPWSSQALCISVFGTIAESPNRSELIQRILDAADVGCEAVGEPELRCEVRGRRDVLNEIGGSNATCPDVLVEWPELTMTIESKFTEFLSPCGQIDLRRPHGLTMIKPMACSGNHEVGSDIRTRTDAAWAEQYSPRHDYAFVLAYVQGRPERRRFENDLRNLGRLPQSARATHDP